MCDLCNGPELKVEKATGTHWVSYCRQCRDSQGRPVLMAASSDHIMMRDEETRAIYAAMEKDLEEVAMRIYGPGNYQLDHQQRQVKDHMHLHARPTPDKKGPISLKQPSLAPAGLTP
ncbi:hypothetical protein ES703_30241 [subsurface metagenome]